MSNKNYKVGDKVKVREDLIGGKEYDGGCLFDTPMGIFKGKITEISDVISSDRWYLKGCSSWWFSPSMLEPVPQDIEKKIAGFEKGLSDLKDGISKKMAGWEQQISDYESGISTLKSILVIQKQAEEKAKEPTYPKFNFAEHMADFCNGKVAVNCRSEESANAFLKLLDGLRIKWAGDAVKPNEFYVYGSETVFTHNFMGFKGLRYGNTTITGEKCETITTFEV
jgi:hypothetical protein